MKLLKKGIDKTVFEFSELNNIGGDANGETQCRKQIYAH